MFSLNVLSKGHLNEFDERWVVSCQNVTRYIIHLQEGESHVKSLDNVAFSGKRMVSTSGLPTRHLALMVIKMMEMMVTISLQLP